MTPSPTITIETRSEAQTIDVARRLAGSLRAGDVVALQGELGAGKTRFVRGLAEGLGIDPMLVTSPTFVLVNLYDSATRAPLAHVDAYRLSSGDDLEALGWDRIMDGDRVVAIEWADRIEDELPEERFRVCIEHGASGESRIIRIDAPRGRDVEFGR